MLAPYSYAELSPVGNPSPSTCAVYVYGVVPAILIVATVVALVRALRMYRRLLMLRDPAVTVVEGFVETDGEGTPPAQLKIFQAGPRPIGKFVGRDGKPILSDGWTETRRVLAARPFYLRMAGGSLMRVDPGKEPILMIRLETIAQSSRGLSRTLAASVVPGLRICVVGAQEKGFDPRAGGGYRSSPEEAVILRPPPGGRMLIAEELPDRPFSARAWFHLRWALALVGILAINQLWFSGYFGRRMHGEVVWVPVADVWEWTTRTTALHGQGGTEEHFAIAAVTSNGRTQVEIGEHDRNLLPKGAKAPFIVVPGSGTSQLGERASLNLFLILGGLLTSLIAALVFLGSSARSLPWFDRSRVNHSTGAPLCELSSPVNFP